MTEAFNTHPHRRYNILTGEWILVSPHRTKRPWQGKLEKVVGEERPTYDPDCFLCPGNTRASGDKNPDYKDPFTFQNDFSALLPNGPQEEVEEGLLKASSETGICRVVCFSPDHSLTLPVMETSDIVKVIQKWKEEYTDLGSRKDINYVMIFENKGDMMGCSNPHPHGQIWSQLSIPVEVQKKTEHQKTYWNRNKKSLLGDYLEQELQLKERIVLQNEHFVALVPYWAIWPYETMIIPRRQMQHIGQLTSEEEKAYAGILKQLTIRYDNLFQTSFPYSSGIHQQPTNGKEYPEWHFHMSFYPPLLRSKTVKKFMVGYELFAGPQRDITAEQAAETLRNLPEVHYTKH
ncbi:UDP-glucose--hexose-1-phosphate uridylyltransferase [Salinimicrobium sediminilitoris]|uniref:UDP-glucose--hexose-1-phosphate uridylyltransferase n=1 Tax=Salinimicrobium sediminilitoris TaxID=2876715 RepID=UPI001E649A0F|nr:UDP-glucose--hexose-1-phosphate uridylyltransferase [Salinimicrobium sediminilitoris]MCC8358848.1 UDP-glucose--hexose-1-phosphate uridylyltransferase [Salinimicrobium sediminilitoris]